MKAQPFSLGKLESGGLREAGLMIVIAAVTMAVRSVLEKKRGKQLQLSAAGSTWSLRRPLSRRIALVCSCDIRDSVTPRTSPISLRVRPS